MDISIENSPRFKIELSGDEIKILESICTHFEGYLKSWSTQDCMFKSYDKEKTLKFIHELFNKIK